MNREFISWDSPILGRRMELLWFGHAGRPMIWFPTSVGRFYQNEDFGLVGAVADLIEGGAIQFACVDSVDAESFYARQKHPAERIRRHDQYDQYVYNEVVPFVRAKGRTGARITTVGASFGAYHAANFGFRHPDAIDKVIAFSGKYDIHNFLDGYWDELCYFHCPIANVPNMSDDWVGRLNTMDLVHRDRPDRQHPLGHHRHAAHPGRKGNPQPRQRLGRALRPRLAVVEDADPQLRALSEARPRGPAPV